jgi:hypothetical protein
MTRGTKDADIVAAKLYVKAHPTIRIFGVGGRKWRRGVAKGARVGPWLPGSYEIVNTFIWARRAPCLYLVGADDGGVRYVGISRNRLKDRWRVSPAYDAETMQRLPQNQLFHAQCWRHIEREFATRSRVTFEVRSISGEELDPVLRALGEPVGAFAALAANSESVVQSVERWLCNHRCDGLARWNVAMTGGTRQGRTE